MIIAWWHKERPQCIDLTDDSILPWINANWIEKSPASDEEIKMYNSGIRHYVIKKCVGKGRTYAPKGKDNYNLLKQSDYTKK